MNSSESISVDTCILVVRPALLAYLSKSSIRKSSTLDAELERWQIVAVPFLPLCPYSNRDDFFYKAGNMVIARSSAIALLR
jgi:hypothetical protein